MYSQLIVMTYIINIYMQRMKYIYIYCSVYYVYYNYIILPINITDLITMVYNNRYIYIIMMCR